MALKTAIATFNGSQDSVDVTWTGIGASHHVSCAVVPTDGSVGIETWLTNHTSGGATVNVSARFTGTVTLMIVDAPSLAPWQTASAFRTNWPIPYTTEVNGGTATVYTRAQFFPSDVTAIHSEDRQRESGRRCRRIHYVQRCTVTTDGSGAASGTALQTWLSQSVPGDGSFWSGGSTAITRGSDGKVVLLQSLAPAATVSCSVTPLVHGTYTAGTSTVSPAPGASGSDPTPISWVEFDYTTSRPRVLVMGDSIPCGVNGVVGYERSWPYQLGVNKNYAVQLLGLPGSSLAQWADYAGVSAAWWARGIFDSGVKFVLNLGANDVPGGVAATMYGYATTIINRARALGVVDVSICTIAPDNAVNEPARTGYNSLAATNSAGATRVIDIAAKQNVGGVADNGAGTALFASYDSGDHLHWTDAGQDQVTTLVSASI
jgi:hypothetical protein